MIEKADRFFKTDLWRIRAKDLPRKKSFWVRPLRILVLSIRDFQEDKCMLRASALTFYSLMSIVPVAALAFGISKGFGFEKALERQLFETFEGQQEVIVMVMDFARRLLETTRGGVLAGVGVFLLFWTVTRVLGNIENSFNYIWGVKKQRSWTRKISDYLSAIVICPVLWIVSSAATVMIRTQITFVVQKGELVESIGPAIFFALNLLPICVIWILFVFIYVFMPNTKVNLRSAIFAAIIAGTFYQLFQRVYLWSQIGVAKYNAIYGSFAALPLFLIWLQLSWLIVLFGAELSFAHQNEKSYEFEPDCISASLAFKRLLSLQVMHLLVKEFAQGGSALSAEQISIRLQIPIILVRNILDELMESTLVSEICVTNRETNYQPGKDIDLLTIKYVIDSLEERGSDDVPVAKSEELTIIAECLKAFSEAVEKSPKNILLREI